MDFAVRGGGKRQVIQDLWFTVRQNEAFAFLGPNGAGKSTTVNILTGMLNQTKGTATVCGKPPGHPEVQRLLGVLPQYDTLFPRLSVHKHLRAFAIIKGVPLDKVDDVIQQAANDATLEKFMFRKVEQLSGGTKRRMSIAIACLGQPAVVILDEPTIGVDVCTRRAIWDMVARLKKSTSILLVTHDMDEAERLCERAGIMINGSLVCLGAPQRLKALFGATYLLKLQFTDSSQIARALAELESTIATMGGNTRVSQQGESHLELCIDMRAAATTSVSSSPSSSATAVTEGLQLSQAALESQVQAHAPFLASLLRFVSSKRAEFAITDWSLGEVSLGELFVQLAPHHHMYQEEEAVV
ncbi:P-loop containing nucleoside triphosphate hydrolase protein [Catenaria anguillulae PL171]|uniref:p-loop containing nucleoside triphosphate hydrolase protein n=1 Tax=Catenaria anguillulae PL171 TaxID=765915 RepID=A0A1Y2HAJ6_9FUNG|nr:P-loop containing nucleoside triphosphate hydrolase protein [Catenaria anguillulae PL171]